MRWGEIMNDLVSVIVPVYNVEQFLDNCVESIVGQNYSNLEILLVDDGATDACPQMCDEWAKKDTRIRVIHKSNGGLSDARNAGLAVCTGRYIVFVDSDDYVHPDYVYYLHQLITENDADLAICEYRIVTSDGKVLNRFADSKEVVIMDQQQALKEMCDGERFSNSAWAKIYSRDAFCDIRFPVGRLFEDVATTYKLFLKAKTIVLGKRPLYNYVRREGSIMTATFNRRRLDAVYYAEKMCEEIVEHWPALLGTTQKRLFAAYMSCWKAIVSSRQKSIEEQELLDELYIKMTHIRKLIKKERLTPPMRYYVIASYFGKAFLQKSIFFESFLKRWADSRGFSYKN